MIFEYTVVYLSCAFVGIAVSILWKEQYNDSITPEQTRINNLEKIYDEIYDNYNYGEEYDRKIYDNYEEKYDNCGEEYDRETYDNCGEEYDRETYDNCEEKEEEEYYLNPLIYDVPLGSSVKDSIPYYQYNGKSCAKRPKTPTSFKEEKRGDNQILKSCLKKT
jgi:hypothetical protein